jgi:hypothetical protein
LRRCGQLTVMTPLATAAHAKMLPYHPILTSLSSMMLKEQCCFQIAQAVSPTPPEYN